MTELGRLGVMRCGLEGYTEGGDGVMVSSSIMSNAGVDTAYATDSSPLPLSLSPFSFPLTILSIHSSHFFVLMVVCPSHP